MKLKINKDFSHYKAGKTVDIPVDKDGIPTTAFWRKRIKDSVLDNCVEVVTEEKKAKAKTKSKSSDEGDR